MKNDNAPKYLKDLSREERELIVRLRSADEQEQKEINKRITESAEKQQNKSLQSIAKTNNK